MLAKKLLQNKEVDTFLSGAGDFVPLQEDVYHYWTESVLNISGLFRKLHCNICYKMLLFSKNIFHYSQIYSVSTFHSLEKNLNISNFIGFMLINKTKVSISDNMIFMFP